DAEYLAQEPVRRISGSERSYPDVLGEVHVGQRGQLVNIPELEGPEEIPVWAAEERTQYDERRPQDRESEQENRDLGFPLGKCEVPIPLRILVDVGNANEADDDEARQHDAREPGIEVNQHFLQAKEV